MFGPWRMKKTYTHTHTQMAEKRETNDGVKGSRRKEKERKGKEKKRNETKRKGDFRGKMKII